MDNRQPLLYNVASEKINISFPVLVFHLVSPELINPNCISPEQFKDIINVLLDDGFSFSDISFSHGLNEARKGKQVILTFDDAYKSVFEYVWPILSSQNIPFTVFAPVKYIGKTNMWNPKANYVEKHLNWEDLKFLVQNKVTIGSHAYSHHSLVKFSYARIKRELELSKTILEERLGRSVDFIAYPYGDISPTVEEISQLIYKAGFSVWQGEWCWRKRPWAINRIQIQSSDHPKVLLKRVNNLFTDNLNERT